ncbi:MAG: hypothetical protein JJE13_02705 [Thermoleophilia bacterium]|nr:hypothetical protein [Thermoleophilia bacterium]
MNRKLKIILTGFCAAIALVAGAQTASAAGKTVTISGKAYVFGHMDTPISNAPIKVREFPKISATTDEIGDYKLKVPNDTNVTPYIPSGSGLLTKRNLDDYSPKGQVQTHWNEIDLQTFHTRGADLVNANFQTPADGEYAGLKAILSVQSGADGRPTQCAIVTTASVRSVRGVDYRTFEAKTAELHGHGVPGGTSIEYPALDGPTYFNKQVIPDKNQLETSEDGGIVWTEVPAGTYRIVTTSPTTRFASFLATCAPGRVVNANPPWGAYQLSKGEKPLGASNVAGSVEKVKAYRKHKTRFISIRVNAGEELTVSGTIKNIRKPGVPAVAATFENRRIKGGIRTVKVSMPRFFQRARIPVKVKVTLQDASGVSFTSTHRVTLPKLKK